MVLAERIGKKRNFVAGFFLSLVTALVYAIYWNYKAHNELYRQFELQKEGRDEGVVWYILGIILPPFLLAYWWIMVSNVRYVRERMRLPAGITPGRFLALTILAFAAYVGALVLGVYASTIDQATATPRQMQVVTLAVSLAVALIGLTFLFAGIAWARLQRDINGVWDAYDRRLMELRAPVVAPAPAGPPPRQPPAVAAWAQSPVTYYADLEPRDPPRPPP